ncbi:hypothetical protein ASE59_02485 [Sphingomonas sp. Leaf10]|nr:hypothetical protein ASE59_02485 [Sphingomonas sp. Leaf10]
MDHMLLKIIGAIATALLALMFSRVATIASTRRTSYSIVAAKLVELWRAGTPKKHDIFVELTKLVMDGNVDLYPAINGFVDSINNAQTDAEDRFLILLERMRSTSFLARVRESFVSSGPSQADLLRKLLVK